MSKRLTVRSQMSIGSDAVRVEFTLGGVDYHFTTDNGDWDNKRELERAECNCVSHRELTEVNEIYTAFCNNAANIKKRGLL